MREQQEALLLSLGVAANNDWIAVAKQARTRAFANATGNR